MTSVAVIAHRAKVLGDGLGRLREVLAEHGVTDPIWMEVPKSRKIPGRVREAIKRSVTIETAREMRYQLDGGARPKTDKLRVCVVPRAVTIRVPTDSG